MEGSGRRGFLRRSSLVVGAFVAGVLGVEPAHASRHTRCCDLCRTPAQCPFPFKDWKKECESYLVWTCSWPRGGGGEGYQVTYACFECYFTVESGHCRDDVGCDNALCSRYQLVGGPYPSPC